MKRIDGKVAVVTGGAQGIGRATALLLAREGAAVGVMDIDGNGAETVAAEIGAAGGKGRAWRLDVTQEDQVRETLAQAAGHFGRIDILVNNAGIVGSQSATDQQGEADWEAVMAVNVKGVMFCTKHVVPWMRAAGGGAIANLCSVYGTVGSNGASAYHASKGAVRVMTKSDALAFAEDGIRVNAVSPGFIWVPPEKDGQALPVGPEIAHNALIEMTPLGRLGEPEDVAHAILFLVSDDARFVNGSELVVDGGYTAR